MRVVIQCLEEVHSSHSYFSLHIYCLGFIHDVLSVLFLCTFLYGLNFIMNNHSVRILIYRYLLFGLRTYFSIIFVPTILDFIRRLNPHFWYLKIQPTYHSNPGTLYLITLAEP